MYKNIQTLCETEGLPIEFVIPNADKAVIDMEDGNHAEIGLENVGVVLEDEKANEILEKIRA